MCRLSSRRTFASYIPEQISTPLPTIQTTVTTELYDDVESTYTDIRYPRSPQHQNSTNASRDSDTLPRKTDLECEYVELQCHHLSPHVQEDSSCNADTLPRKVDVEPSTATQEEEEDHGLITTGENAAYSKRTYRKYSLPLHETSPYLPHGGGSEPAVGGSLTLANPAILPLTSSDPQVSHSTQSDPGIIPLNLTPTDPETSAYHEQGLTPSLQIDPEITPNTLNNPEVVRSIIEPNPIPFTMENPEIYNYDEPTNSEFNPSPLPCSQSAGVTLTPPKPGSPGPIYANIQVVKDEVSSITSSMKNSNRVRALVYQFENQILPQTEDEAEEEP